MWVCAGTVGGPSLSAAAPRDFYLLKPIETAETRNYTECGLNPTVQNCPELATSQSRAATQSLNTGPGIHTGIQDLYADDYLIGKRGLAVTAQ